MYIRSGSVSPVESRHVANARIDLIQDWEKDSSFKSIGRYHDLRFCQVLLLSAMNSRRGERVTAVTRGGGSADDFWEFERYVIIGRPLTYY